MTESTRTKLITISIEQMAIKGFNNTGIAEILAIADVPKGSFYHYFKSKDELGLAIIDHYGQTLRHQFSSHLQNSKGPALMRLRSYFELVLEYFGNDVRLCNCLLGNLGQELSMQSAPMRDAIYRHYRALELLISECLTQAKLEGDLSSTIEEQVLAKLFFSSWEGCLVRARLEQSPEPLRNLIDLYFSEVF